MLPLLKMPSKVSISAQSEKSFASSKQTSAKKTATFKTKNFLKKRNDLSIIFKEDDVTPKLLNAIDAGSKNDILSLSQLEVRSQYELSVFGNVSANVLHTHMHSMVVSTPSYISTINKEDVFDESLSIQTDVLSDAQAEEAFVYVPPRAMPTHLNITLTETPVIYLFEMVSQTEVKGTVEGDQVEKDNEQYDYLTIGKGRNRKTTNAEIQTQMNLLKTRSTNAERSGKNHGSTFVSEWEMHDTFDAIEEETDLDKPEIGKTNIHFPNLLYKYL